MVETVALFSEFCHIFGIPAETLPRNAYYRLPDNVVLLDGSAFKLDDARALALSCALLKTCRISNNVLCKFIKAYLESAEDSHFCCSVRRALASDNINSIVLKSQSKRIPLPCTRWSFRGSQFTGIGAASLIAAAAIVSNGIIEVDMSTCPGLHSIELMPWSDIVNEMRFSTESVRFGLRGLRLDGCPLRSFGRHPQDVLYGLEWLSFRETRVRNLWVVISILRDVPSLRAVLIYGSARNRADIVRIRKFVEDRERMVNQSPKRKTSLRRDFSKCDGTLASLSNVSSNEMNRNAYQCSTPDTHVPSNPRPKEIRDSGIPYLDVSAFPNPESLYLVEGACSIPTPVASQSHYRPFLLAHSKPSLTILDGVAITKEEIAAARQHVRCHFDVPVREVTKPPAPISSLLRNREISVSQTRFLQGKPSHRLESTPKRRRNSHYGLSEHARTLSSDFSCGNVRAEQCANSCKLRGQLPQSTSVYPASESPRIAPKLALYNAAHGRRLLSERQSFIGIQSPLSSENSSFNEAHFHHQSFEVACANELLTRTGRPHIEYYCKPRDCPRQFEYNPIDTRFLVYGTEHGTLTVLNQETMSVAASCQVGGGPGTAAPGTRFLQDFRVLPELRRNNQAPIIGHNRYGNVLAISWFNKDPNLFISGCEEGSIHIYNVDRMSMSGRRGCVGEAQRFEQLTSLHTNCVDEKFLVSGYHPVVGLFDLSTGTMLETIRGCHDVHINVLRFAHSNPNVFVTSSFDKTVKKWDLRERRPGGTRRPIFECKSDTGNVMVCFSPDDEHLLVSAVDNEVKQYRAADGRLEQSFDIPKTYSEFNYTRSYYMNGSDYIITGSCAEDIVRVYNARTGCLHREIDLDDRKGRRDGRIFVQSLRPNPRRKYNFSALVASNEVGPYNILANISLLERE